LCSREIVTSAEERRSFWRQLKGIAGLMDKVDVGAAVQAAKTEMVQNLTSALLGLSGASGTAAPVVSLEATGSAPAPAGEYEPVWIDTPECTACDECTDLAPGIFKYNEDKLAIVINPQGGSYKDIVRSAEKCTAGCIHPGTPWDMNEKGIDKLVARADNYQ